MVEPLKKILHMSLLDKKLDTYYQAASVLIYILMCSNDMKGLREIATGLPWQLENTSQELKNTLLILDMVRSIGEEQFGQGETQSETILYDHLSEDSKWLYLILACIIYHCLGKLDERTLYGKQPYYWIISRISSLPVVCPAVSSHHLVIEK